MGVGVGEAHPAPWFALAGLHSGGRELQQSSSGGCSLSQKTKYPEKAEEKWEQRHRAAGGLHSALGPVADIQHNVIERDTDECFLVEEGKSFFFPLSVFYTSAGCRICACVVSSLHVQLNVLQPCLQHCKGLRKLPIDFDVFCLSLFNFKEMLRRNAFRSCPAKSPVQE